MPKKNIEIKVEQETLRLKSIFVTGTKLDNPDMPQGENLAYERFEDEAAEARVNASDSRGDYSLKRDNQVYETGKLRQIVYLGKEEHKFYFSFFADKNMRIPRLLRREVILSPVS